MPDVSTIHGAVILALYGLTLAAVWRRSKFFRIFVGVMVGINALIWWALFVPMSGPIAWVAMVFEALVAVHFIRLAKPRLRSIAYRTFVSVPAHFFAAGTMLAFPFAIAAAFGLRTDAFWLAYVAAGIGVIQSLGGRTESIDLILDGSDRGSLAPCPRVASSRDIEARGKRAPDPPALRVVQITDPHLGPFMSPERLARVCERAVEMQPDLVLITGDLLTMESHGARDEVAQAFAPLMALPGRVFACHGNHDHEDRETVREGLTRAGVHLLVDEWATVDTPVGPVDVIGADFHWKERKERLHALFEGKAYERPRLLMLHHPGHIEDAPEGCADLTLTGHTHGGHLGLVSLGLDWTVVRAATSIPDHGLWARGRDRVYVHRGTGHYGFPVRIGVPREESVLRVVFAQ